MQPPEWNLSLIGHIWQVDDVIRATYAAFSYTYFGYNAIEPAPICLWDTNSILKILYHSSFHHCFFAIFLNNLNTWKVTNRIMKYSPLLFKPSGTLQLRQSQVQRALPRRKWYLFLLIWIPPILAEMGDPSPQA